MGFGNCHRNFTVICNFSNFSINPIPAPKSRRNFTSMKTRPHIVTQSRVYDTAGLYRSASLLTEGIKTAGPLGDVLGYSRILIRVMKIILDLTLHNNCFVRRRDVLASATLRGRVMERLGGAHALMTWRRKNIWNKARLAAIASGSYCPPAGGEGSQTGAPVTAEAPEKSQPANASKPPADPEPFRLPVLKSLRPAARPRAGVLRRAKPQRRFPSIVLWPHELDGQYVPGFENRARRPDGGGYSALTTTSCAAGYRQSKAFFPP